MKFADPKILIYLLWILPIVIIFYGWVIIKRRSLIRKFAEKELIEKILPQDKKKRTVLLPTLRVLSIVFILLALARPQWGFLWGENSSKGYDILMALDTSRSMLAGDIFPDRLQFSKESIKNFINGLKNDRVGLIAFSGQAFLQCPLTVDHDGVLLVLKSLNTESIPRGGTSIAEAIEEAIKSYQDNVIGEKLLILITDGENTSGALDKALSRAKEKEIVISCIGIGSIEGEQIFLLNEQGERETLKDKDGKVIRTILDEETLKKIANETGGVYVRATQEEFGLWEAYEEVSKKLNKNTITDNITKIYEERFQLFLVIAFILLMFELLFERSNKKP